MHSKVRPFLINRRFYYNVFSASSKTSVNRQLERSCIAVLFARKIILELILVFLRVMPKPIFEQTPNVPFNVSVAFCQEFREGFSIS